MRLIDADALECHVVKSPVVRFEFIFKSEIDNAPTVDAVPVVRCINCKYNDSDESIRYRFCPDPTGRFFLLNGFCSCGERKDNEL